MSNTRLPGGKLVRISEYLEDHPHENRKRLKGARPANGADECPKLPRLGAQVMSDGEVTYGVEDAAPYHARPLLLAALSMCIDLVLLRDGLR